MIDTMMAATGLAVPLTYAAGAALVGRVGRVDAASHTGLIAFLSALVATLVCVASPPSQARLLGLDPLSACCLTLVTAIAWVILRFSANYLRGEANVDGHTRWLFVTLAAVATVLLARHLGLLVAAWISASFSLHRLLRFYPNRKAAQVAAHKKFLVSRAADMCLLAATLLVARGTGTLQIDEVNAFAAVSEKLPVSLHAAGVLIALAVCLKSAQLPFHGWLLQVMEAPTPVSALLHAGVVNLGGILLIRFASLFVHLPAAQTLLVVVGCVTAAVSALVMSAQVSVKVTLAWSTCAQIGFMLAQCGLGAYTFAIIHLFAHSLYKAHAFLNSGTAVSTWKVASLTRATTTVSVGVRLVAWMACLAVVSAIAHLGSLSVADEPAFAVLGGVLAVGLGELLAPVLVQRDGRALMARVGQVVGLACVYMVCHRIAAAAFTLPTEPWSRVWLRVGIGCLVMGVFAVVHVGRLARPHAPLWRALNARLLAGFWIDEHFTRVAFRLWPLGPVVKGRRPQTQSIVPVGVR